MKKIKSPEIKCPTCASTNTHFDGWRISKSLGKVHRVKCKDCSSHWLLGGTTPTIQKADSLPETHMDTLLHELVSSKVNYNLVITCAQNATAVHKGFLSAINTYTKANKSHLVVIPIRYRNPTSIWTDKDKDDDWWDSQIVPNLITKRVILCSNLELLGDIRIQPTAQRPLTGLETITHDRSSIVGHPKLELKSIATPANKLPKVLWTTGAITKKNYTITKAGKIGEHHHSFGAIVLSVRGKYFHARHIISGADGSFQDLDNIYYPDGRIEKAPVKAMVAGDLHFEFLDPVSDVGVFHGEKSIVNVLKPEKIVYHDAWDGYSISHHHKRNPVIQYVKHKTKNNNAIESLKALGDWLNTLPGNTEHVFIASNHPEWLERYVFETDPRTDPENALFWAESYTYMINNATFGLNGTSYPDLFSYWMSKYLKIKHKFVFRGESYRVCNIELGFHSDMGVGGAKGNIAQFGKVGSKSIIGHHHSLAIQDGVWQTGMLGSLTPDYAKGTLSSWIHAVTVVYSTGKITHIIVLPDGSWM